MKFSEQQLIDCVKPNHGCAGGNVAHAFGYYEQHDALFLDGYPYTGRNGKCTDNIMQFGSGVKTHKYSNVKKNDPVAMKVALERGPLTVAVEADHIPFQNYKSGIFDNVECGEKLDHALTLVGWGKQYGREYWIVRNSWGRSWGENGYMRMAIESGQGVCGVQKDPVYPRGVN